MITLITGAPGVGKTALLVEWLRTIYKDRPIYVDGLEGLTLEHQPLDLARWHLDVPDGAIIVGDEAQKTFRPRGPGHAAPMQVTELETHRHRGIDIFLTTQKPNLLDLNVRGLVGRHVHIRDTGWRGRWIYEWPEISETLAWKTCHLKAKYKLPKKSFGLYKSASEHTTVRKGQSWMPMITLGLFGAFLGVAFMVVKIMQRHSGGDVATAPTQTASAPSAPRLGPIQHRPDEITGASMVVAFTPRLAEDPATAPAFDHLRHVVNLPRIVGGYCVGQKCRCLNNQNLDAGLTQDACRRWLKNPPFDPYNVRADLPDARPRQEATPPPPTATIARAGT